MGAPSNWFYVTGCDSGFGSVVVKELAALGYGVFATHMLPASADTLRSAHANILPLRVDITSQASVDEAAKAIASHLGPGQTLQGLVNNAGIMVQSGPAEWTPADNFEKMFAVNLIGASRVTNSVLPLLRKSRGRIVNVASLAGRVSMPFLAAYSASKYAMEGYSDCLRRELYAWGVTVHIIEPVRPARSELALSCSRARTAC